MRADELLQAIGEVDEVLIERAAKKDRSHLVRWGALAAMLMLVIGLSLFVFRDVKQDETAKPQTMSDIRMAFLTSDPYDRELQEHIMQYEQLSCTTYSPEIDSLDDRVKAIERAIGDGCNVVFCNGYEYAGALLEIADEYPDVKLIGMNISNDDLYWSGSYDFSQPKPENILQELELNNVLCVSYQNEIAGYLAGYVAVREGYHSLGYYCDMMVPQTIDYGNGYLLGAQAAAQEMQKTDEVIVKVSSYGMFASGEASPILKEINLWHQGGTQLVLAVGPLTLNAAEELPMTVIAAANHPQQAQSPLIYLKQDTIIVVEQLMEELLSDRFEGGKLCEVPYHQLSDADGDWSFQSVTQKECRSVLQELIDGTRTCPKYDYLQEENYSIHVIFE
ncbi:MAG: BMP family ABC transporter substrate-binding protein [Ruminococcaceae bacterium]|nr:BMP family ABC transporter substrate-binding protein [Oscillospiraceae bacterium]